MLTLRLAHENELNEIFALFQRAFPRSERPPMYLLKSKADKIKTYSIVEKNELKGMMMVIEYSDIVYLDYFAIMEDYRNSGIGSSALQLLYDLYPGKRLALCIEKLDDPKSRNTEERIKRKNFYLRNGYKESGVSLSLIMGPQLEILNINGSINYEEYKSIMTHTFGKFYYALLRVRQLSDK